jgi:hypothetical protein
VESAVERGERTRGAFGARLETLVGARSDDGAWPPALTLRDSTRLCGQFSRASISLADRDLVIQDLSLVLVPGMRLGCLPRARRGERRTRGAFGARVETLVGARSDDGAWPPALTLRDSTRLCGQFSWASISLADRDLVIQDLSLVLVPGMRLGCLPRARREGVRR